MQAAERTYLKLQNFVQTLNGNVDLYKSLVDAKIEEDESQTEELRRVAQTLRQDFERGGIHLTDEKKKKIRGIFRRRVATWIPVPAKLDRSAANQTG